MVGVDDVDDELEPEIKEEMSKYGQVTSIKIHVVRLSFFIIINFYNYNNCKNFVLFGKLSHQCGA